MVRVLIVDDSRSFRKVLRILLESDNKITVIAEAANGEEAIEMTEQHHPDVITMDIEMPKMDGVTAVKNIMSKRPTAILMFSNLTERGAAITLEALHAGASDFLEKNNFNLQSADYDENVSKLINQIKVLALKNKYTHNSEEFYKKLDSNSSAHNEKSVVRISSYDLIAIGASTGGPAALETVLTKLPETFRTPIIIIQHMPALFTKAFAERLDMLCKIKVTEIIHREDIKPGRIYVAPGGKQTYINRVNNQLRFSVSDTDPNPEIIYKPCINETFTSISEACNKQKVLSIIMSGMGKDGCDGVKKLKKIGADVWVQDKSSSVIYGMPMVVAQQNLADKVLAVDEIGYSLSKSA